MTSQLDILAEAISGWHDKSERMEKVRERAREWSRVNKYRWEPWTTEELVTELELLIGTDKPENIARRLRYASVDNLLTKLRRNGLDDLAARLMAGNEASRAQRNRGTP
jgi:hypothetical protein